MDRKEQKNYNNKLKFINTSKFLFFFSFTFKPQTKINKVRLLFLACVIFLTFYYTQNSHRNRSGEIIL